MNQPIIILIQGPGTDDFWSGGIDKFKESFENHGAQVVVIGKGIEELSLDYIKTQLQPYKDKEVVIISSIHGLPQDPDHPELTMPGEENYLQLTNQAQTPNTDYQKALEESLDNFTEFSISCYGGSGQLSSFANLENRRFSSASNSFEATFYPVFDKMLIQLREGNIKEAKLDDIGLMHLYLMNLNTPISPTLTAPRNESNSHDENQPVFLNFEKSLIELIESKDERKFNKIEKYLATDKKFLIDKPDFDKLKEILLDPKTKCAEDIPPEYYGKALEIAWADLKSRGIEYNETIAQKKATQELINILQSRSGGNLISDIEELISQGADLKSNQAIFLFSAYQKQDIKLLNYFIEKGISVNSGMVPATGSKALPISFSDYVFSNSADEEIFKIVINNGGNINAIGRGGPIDCTPLHEATRGNIKTLELLKKYGADFNATDERGRTAISYFVWDINPGEPFVYFKEKNLEFLLNNDLIPNEKDIEAINKVKGQLPTELYNRIYNKYLEGVINNAQKDKNVEKPEKEVLTGLQKILSDNGSLIADEQSLVYLKAITEKLLKEGNNETEIQEDLKAISNNALLPEAKKQQVSALLKS